MKAGPPNPHSPDHLTYEEFESFLQAFTHEIRNRLNGIALEAADLAEQAGDQADADRLQQQVQDVSAFLKTVRDMFATENPQGERAVLSELTKKLKDRTPLK